MERFTVIIPALDRCETLAHTLESCTAQQDDHFEILVSDNLSTDRTREIVEDFRARDPRVKLIQPPRRLGQSRHWEFALSHVPEGFLMILGADDALLPRCMPRARACLREHPKCRALGSDPCVTYIYPDAGGEEAGKLKLILTASNEVRNSRRKLDEVIGGKCNVTELPFPYACSWSHVSVLQEAQAITGRLIPCRMAPVYMAVATARFAGEHPHVTPGFACTGVSKMSIGYSLQHAHGDRQRDRVYFEETNIEDRDIPFHPLVGDSRAGKMHVAETLLMCQETGLLPPDPPIAWDRLIALAHREFCWSEWSKEDRRSNFESLLAISRNMGCEAIMQSAASCKDWRQWKAQLPFPLDDPDLGREYLEIQTGPLQLAGVHEAVRLADAILQARIDRAQGFVSADEVSAEQLLWCLTEALAQQRELSDQLVVRKMESERRASERDRMKEKFAGLRTRLETLRSKMKPKDSVSLTRFLRRWWNP